MKYDLIKDQDKQPTSLTLEENGVVMSVPLDPRNRHYQMIKEDYEKRKKKPFKFDFDKVDQ